MAEYVSGPLLFLRARATLMEFQSATHQEPNTAMAIKQCSLYIWLWWRMHGMLATTTDMMGPTTS